MARRILNRKELRVTNDEAERQEPAKESEEGKVVEPKAAKKPVKRKSRAKVAKEVRLKAFWGVFNQAMAQVAQFEYSQRDEAQRKADDLNESKKAPHFIQLIKKVIEE